MIHFSNDFCELAAFLLTLSVSVIGTFGNGNRGGQFCLAMNTAVYVVIVIEFVVFLCHETIFQFGSRCAVAELDFVCNVQET